MLAGVAMASGDFNLLEQDNRGQACLRRGRQGSLTLDRPARYFLSRPRLIMLAAGFGPGGAP